MCFISHLGSKIKTVVRIVRLQHRYSSLCSRYRTVPYTKRFLTSLKMTSPKKPFERLPKTIVPTHYDITLHPDLDTFQIYGQEFINLQVHENTDKIILNAVNLTFKFILLNTEDGSVIEHKETEINEDAETATLNFRSAIPKGKAKLQLKYEAELNDKLKGFYRSKYITPSGEARYAAVTQFEATDARRAFPCWDEPAIKATFDITLIAPHDRVALSNMEVISDVPLDGDSNLKKVKFATSPIMSTYLVACVVGEFDYCEGKSADGVNIRVYTPLGKKEQGQFACEVAVKVLPYYKEYFNVAYPLSKLDLIAAADLAAGAMENWGLVTYRETCLLVDPKNTSSSLKQWVVLVVAHELAHQWFGNLVTMEWWTHLWLNEGFASWIEYLCADYLFPEYDIWTQFVTDTLSRALDLDALASSHPIEVPVGHPSEVDEIFDDISYSKGASVIRMLHSYIGDEDFRKGMNHYLTKYKYQNTYTENLWSSLGHASGKPVGDVMSTWTKQMGFPLIKVSSRQEGTSRILTISQEKFYADNKPDGKSSKWLVPISISTSRQPKQVTKKFLLDSKSAEITIEDVGLADWVKLNPGAVGYYRVQYPTSMLSAFLPAIRDQSLPPLDRLSLQDDLFALVQSGQCQTVDVLELMESFVNETNYTVWNSINECVRQLSILLSHTALLDDFKAFVRHLFTPVGKLVGWKAAEGEKHMDVLLRSLVLTCLGSFGDEETVSEARRRFEKHVDGTCLLPADLRVPVYRAVLTHGDETTLEAMLKLYKKTDLQEERDRISRALGCLKQKELLSCVINFAMSEEVRAQDKVFVIIGVALNKEGRDLAWNYFRENFDTFTQLYSGGFLISRLVKFLTENFANEERAIEVEQYFSAHSVPAAERTVQQSVEKIRLNSQWLARDQAQIGEWLEKLKTKK